MDKQRKLRILNGLQVICLLVIGLLLMAAVRERRIDSRGLAANLKMATERLHAPAKVPHLTGHYPCVWVDLASQDRAPRLGECSIPAVAVGPIDRAEADLRFGRFVLRETDLYVDDVFQVPLTRTYSSQEWVNSNPVHAFGRNTNHPYDIAPVGTRNPYTYQYIALEGNDFLFFDRISVGTSYKDAVFQHTETATRFYKATTAWNGHGWTTRLTDGEEIDFPESYLAKNAAQGAPWEIRDGRGNRLLLLRDGERNLLELTTPHGHWIKFSYDDQARIKRAHDDKGNWALYGYNEDGMLKTVVLSSGKVRRFEYDPRHHELLTAISDQNGQVLLTNHYTHRILDEQRAGKTPQTLSITWDWPAGQYYVNEARVLSSDGSTKTIRVADTVPAYIREWKRYSEGK